jgi:hydrogenase expression/formation protein HypD
MNPNIRYIDDFRDPATARALVERIRRDAGDAPVRLMEVCGTHTVAIARGGIRPLLSGAVTMLSGPGCPVCVTPDGYIDAAIALGNRPPSRRRRGRDSRSVSCTRRSTR